MAEGPLGSSEFYACLDLCSIGEVPQALQHLIIGNMSQALGGKVVFFAMEQNVYSASTHEVLRLLLAKKPRVDGFIFYRLRQFFGQGKLDLSFLREILKAGYHAHFARERLSLFNDGELTGLHRLVSTTKHTSERDQRHLFFRDAYSEFLK